MSRAPTEPRRRWFQLHLSTAVVLMFAVCVCICLNLLRFHTRNDPSGLKIEGQGWPFIYREYYLDAQNQYLNEAMWDGIAGYGDLALCIAFLYLLATILEHRIRRKAAPAHDSADAGPGPRT